MRFLIGLIIILASINTQAAKQNNDVYKQHGVIVTNAPWEIVDYEVFYDFCEGGVVPLPKYNDPASRYVFEKLVSEKNLSVLDSKKISLEDKFYVVADFSDTFDNIMLMYLNTHDKTKQNNERELAHIISLHARLQARGLELIEESIENAIKEKSSKAIIDELKGGRNSQTKWIELLINQFEKTHVYSNQSFVVLSETILKTIHIYTQHLDKKTKRILKNKIYAAARKCPDMTAKRNLQKSVLNI